MGLHARFKLIVLCEEALIPELDFLLTPELENEIHIIRPQGKVDIRAVAHTLPLIKLWRDPPGNLLKQIRADLLYAGFGFSEFHDKTIPQISLIVDSLHADLPEHLPDVEVKARDFWFPVAIQQASRVQTNSNFCIERLITHFDLHPDKALRIYLPLHERFVNTPMDDFPKCLEGKSFFFYPSNFWSHKNHEILIIAYQKYLRECEQTPWDLALTGDTSNACAQQIVDLVETLGLQAHVHFLGHLKDGELKHTWELSKALVFPSLYEGFGLPIVEAMHFQTPIACSNCASMPEIAKEAALYFDPRKPVEIADALQRLSNDETLRKQLIENGLKRLPLFNFDRELDELIEVIDELVAEKNPSEEAAR